MILIRGELDVFPINGYDSVVLVIRVCVQECPSQTRGCAGDQDGRHLNGWKARMYSLLYEAGVALLRTCRVLESVTATPLS